MAVSPSFYFTQPGSFIVSVLHSDHTQRLCDVSRSFERKKPDESSDHATARHEQPTNSRLVASFVFQRDRRSEAKEQLQNPHKDTSYIYIYILDRQ